MTERSVTGAIWREAKPETAHVEGLVSTSGMPLAAAIMAAGAVLSVKILPHGLTQRSET